MWQRMPANWLPQWAWWSLAFKVKNFSATGTQAARAEKLALLHRHRMRRSAQLQRRVHREVAVFAMD
jgi:hypothetical protein